MFGVRGEDISLCNRPSDCANRIDVGYRLPRMHAMSMNFTRIPLGRNVFISTMTTKDPMTGHISLRRTLGKGALSKEKETSMHLTDENTSEDDGVSRCARPELLRALV